MCYTMIKHEKGISEYEENVKITSHRRVLFTFLKCSQIVLSHSNTHGLGFYIFFKIQILHTASSEKQ